ncbi:probable alpha-aspartyl dipeptidase [Aricia agestis]|uniref:probable alpha-aspartyl dipeptidase n=1 Tax=Aricia agestis TaxID=91739 RepID=UPI001C20898A|nr:probable alpha-aspartyl dipeptidase [Aricia agestis]
MSHSISYLALNLLKCTRNIHLGTRTFTNINVTMEPNPQALLLSSSNCFGFNLLEFAKKDISEVLEKNAISEIIFIPYAQNDYEKYTKTIQSAMVPWGFTVKGIQEFPDPNTAINSAKAIFIGGGNTFLLLKRLYENNLVEQIRKRVMYENLIYIGSSAGTNVATKSIHTTNDMPIVYPPTFDAISLIPFNINPHYIEKPDLDKHRGETRDQRIGEFLQMPHANYVLGLKEGSILHVNKNLLIIKGVAGAVLFKKGQDKCEIPVGEDVSYLLHE